MRITRLELSGFKSFPQRTTLDLPHGVTAIVGPNGCGKSNLVDAIRWALGEQSAKHLRGDAMEAVIFNGNEKHAPLGMAEVSITFANGAPARPLDALDIEMSTLPAHLRDLAEITVTRRYFRSGESEYSINRVPCRLKDITELFLGTGVGSRAYSIIEQGRVEQLISAKPEERRLFIEEAAGTTLYRSRKLAAERKMERTRENLARVNDIVREIDRQAQSLSRQAKKAETHRRLTEELRALDLRVAGRQWRGLAWETAAAELRRTELIAEAERLRAALDEHRREQAEAAARAAAAEKEHAARREALAVLDAECASLRQRIALLGEQRDERGRRLARFGDEAQALRAAAAHAAEKLRRAEREREDAAQYLLFDEGEIARREEEMRAARAALAAAQEALDAAKTALVGHATREAEARNNAATLARRREEVARRLDKLRAEEEAIDRRLAELEALGAARRADVDRLRGELAAASGEQAARAEELRQLAEVRRRHERAVHVLDGEAVQIASRLESLQHIQSTYEGFQRGVRAVMREERPGAGVLGVVADVIDVPHEYERAVAAALGARLQCVIVEGEEHGASAVGRLREAAAGRGSFIPIKPRSPDLSAAKKLNGTSRRLLDLVRVEERYRPVAESLLGDVALVPDLDSAIGLWRQNGVRVTLVTPHGDVVDPTGVISGGSDHLVEEEILARRREIERLQHAAAAAGTRLVEQRGLLAETARATAAAEAALAALGHGAHDLSVRIVAAEKDADRIEIERPQALSRRDVVRYEIDTLLGDAAAAAAEEAEVGERLSGLLGGRDALEHDVASRRAEADDAARRAEALGGEVTAIKVRTAQRRERQQAALAAVETLRHQQAELAERSRAIETERAATTAEHARLEEDLAAACEREAAGCERRAALDGAVADAARAVGECGGAARAAEQAVGRQQAALDAMRDACAQADLDCSELRLRAEHLVESVREKYATDLTAAAAAEDSPRASDDGAEDERARVEEIRERLQRLGEVNLTAIDELRELEERGGFLRTQRDDLERSLADLEQTIQKLNRASRTRFAETFAKANETFQQVVPRLFRGGEGRLLLTDENDLLNAGVEIVVRPPGKRLDTVTLLSGGEKALVAVSLIFSLFLINPTPFCILDEVDAPLDDANVGRFGHMVREMSAHSQFLLITHNKRTMENAAVLYGVTMQEPGISRIISVAMQGGAEQL